VDVVVVVRSSSPAPARGELVAGGALHIAQVSPAPPAGRAIVLSRDGPAVGQGEGRDVEGIPERVLGDLGVGISVHAAAGISRDLLDLGDRRAEPMHRRRLHRVTIQRSSSETIGHASVAGGFTATGAIACGPRVGPSGTTCGSRSGSRIGAASYPSTSRRKRGPAAHRRAACVRRVPVKSLARRARQRLALHAGSRRRSGRRRPIGPAEIVGVRCAPVAIDHARGIEGDRLVAACVRRSRRRIRRRRRVARPDRPALGGGAARDCSRRTRVIGVASGALSPAAIPSKENRTAHAGAADLLDADDAPRFLDRARVEALHLGVVPPRFALDKNIAAAATREHTEDAENADRIPTNSHAMGRENAMDFVNEPFKDLTTRGGAGGGVAVWLRRTKRAAPPTWQQDNWRIWNSSRDLFWHR